MAEPVTHRSGIGAVAILAWAWVFAALALYLAQFADIAVSAWSMIRPGLA